jgi:Phage Mu protein F like protein
LDNQNQIDKHLDKMIDKAERDIDIVFAKRLKSLSEQIAEWYRKYSEKGELNVTALYQYNRLQKELKFIAEQIHYDYVELYNEIDKLLKEQYLEQLLRSGYLYEMEAQTEMGYTIPSVSTINQAILNPIKELTLSALMQTHRNEVIRKINIEIGQSLQAGESYSELAERLEKVLGFNSTKAKRVARTESGRVQTLARMDSAKHAEKYAKLKKVWNATLDGEVRTSHRILDDQEADEEGYFHFKGYKAQGPHLFQIASLDINCRCSIAYMVNGKRPELRRARDYQDADYQQKLADRIEKYMGEGMTEKQAEKKAKKEVKPPSQVIEYKSYAEWRKGLKR